MDFGKIMLFTQQVFHLQHLFFFYIFLIPEITYKKPCNIVLQSSKHEETTYPHKFLFLCYPIFYWGYVIKKMFSKVGAMKKYIKGGGDIWGVRGVAYRGGVQTSCKLRSIK